MGDPKGFAQPGEGWFWPEHKGPKDAFHRIYEGGIIVPLLIGMFLMVVTFSIERFLTISKALGKVLSLTSFAKCSIILLIVMQMQRLQNATDKEVQLQML